MFKTTQVVSHARKDYASHDHHDAHCTQTVIKILHKLCPLLHVLGVPAVDLRCQHQLVRPELIPVGCHFATNNRETPRQLLVVRHINHDSRHAMTRPMINTHTCELAPSINPSNTDMLRDRWPIHLTHYHLNCTMSEASPDQTTMLCIQRKHT